MNPPFGDRNPAAWCAAIVCAADGVRFLAIGPSRASLLARLAQYVEEQAPRKLGPVEATQVHQLLGSGALEVAVDLYFASVGGRWDEEWLHHEEIALTAADGDL
jgi:hypothetical protein